jgi:hypothetical protein
VTVVGGAETAGDGFATSDTVASMPATTITAAYVSRVFMWTGPS